MRVFQNQMALRAFTFVPKGDASRFTLPTLTRAVLRGLASAGTFFELTFLGTENDIAMPQLARE